MDKKRHTLAHLLAASVGEIYKFDKIKLTLGPAIENGFYYDIDFGGEKVIDADLQKIENRMRKILPKWTEWEHKEISKNEALEFFKNEYKAELINEIAECGEKITTYTCGGFTDLCRGGHLVNPAKEIDPESFKLDRVAGAYWRGNEKNKMLTRIYGLAFNTKEELEAYLKQREEAEKIDHRKIGQELDIFILDDDVGPGLPLWLPNGAVIIEELEKLAKETEEKAGYARVRTPHIAKESMYKKSGHLPYYADSMYPPMDCEGENYYLKAMNCPHHHKIFAARPKSYRDLPLRLAEYGVVYRYEKSGELFGLMRVRSLSMNDAHIYCSEKQFADEFRAVNEMYLKYFKIFGIEKYIMRFSTHDPKELGKKYVSEPELWLKTEKMVRNVLIESKIPYVEVQNEAAFYGPKIDVQVWSAIGREFTLATNQVDFAVPKRFDLTFTNKKGKQETPLCIHRAPLGTHERFIGFLIEHYAGAFPVWLSPVQVKVIPVRSNHNEYAKKVYEALKENGVRAELDDADENLGTKVRSAKNEKIPYWIVVGDKEIEAKKITLESRDAGQLGQMSKEDLLQKLLEEIKNKK